ncbi:MAG: 3-oxoacyl-[acyl-carrier-protein] reductase [Cyclobacteriaceae bacterium]|nr:3-oxoacyl-[acyl-carrier-protein] reductase [Cyclobacteriaceae bacterium]
MKYALVTGGSRGIGKAVALQLADMGFNILLNYNSNEVAAAEVKKLIEEKGVKAESIKFDVSDRDQTKSTLSNWFLKNPDDQIEVLVNNAGIRKDNLLLWMEDEQWDDVINISLGGFYNVTKAVIGEMIKEKGGRIINIVSLSGLKGMPGQTNYSAAKAAVIGATKALAQEVGRRKITVNAVAPGFISTDMTEDIDEKQFKGLIPLKRFGTAEEVAHLVGFLASPHSSYITGEVISINGGLL